MTTMLLLFGAVLALVLINVPIAVSLGIVALAAMMSSHGLVALPNLALVTYNGATNFPLLAIPLFILAGAIMNASGISRRLIAFASSLFGWIRGGLSRRAPAATHPRLTSTCITPPAIFSGVSTSRVAPALPSMAFHLFSERKSYFALNCACCCASVSLASPGNSR